MLSASLVQLQFYKLDGQILLLRDWSIFASVPYLFNDKLAVLIERTYKETNYEIKTPYLIYRTIITFQIRRYCSWETVKQSLTTGRTENLY